MRNADRRARGTHRRECTHAALLRAAGSPRPGPRQRECGTPEAERVALLRTLFDAGLSSRTIARLLPSVDTPSLRTAEDAFATMARERDRLREAMGTLGTAVDALERLMAGNSEHRAALAAVRPAGSADR